MLATGLHRNSHNYMNNNSEMITIWNMQPYLEETVKLHIRNVKIFESLHLKLVFSQSLAYQ